MSGIHLALLGMSFGAAIPDIGAAYEGGFFAGQIGTGGVATHNLVVAPLSSGQTQTNGKPVTLQRQVHLQILMAQQIRQLK
jgi:hypothetical protein